MSSNFFLNTVLVGMSALILYFSINLVPFSVWVDVEYTNYSDMKCGECKQLLMSSRTPLWNIPGTFQAQLFRYDDGDVIETTITRQGEFGYEKGDFVTYEIEWDENIYKPGVYGASTFVTIHPLPFVYITKYFPPEDAIFNVICD